MQTTRDAKKRHWVYTHPRRNTETLRKKQKGRQPQKSQRGTQRQKRDNHTDTKKDTQTCKREPVKKQQTHTQAHTRRIQTQTGRHADKKTYRDAPRETNIHADR